MVLPRTLAARSLLFRSMLLLLVEAEGSLAITFTQGVSIQSLDWAITFHFMNITWSGYW